jgi:hypothetical protein
MMLRYFFMTTTLGALLLASCAPSTPTRAVQGPVKAAGYSATPGEGVDSSGQFDYRDDGSVQLTDGQIGADDHRASVNKSPGFEWVGWYTTDPTLNFNFPNNIETRRVTIGFSRVGFAGIELPERIVINGKSFALKKDQIKDKSRDFIAFDGTFGRGNLRIELFRRSDPTTKNGKNWIFIDEVVFDGTTFSGAGANSSTGDTPYPGLPNRYEPRP